MNSLWAKVGLPSKKPQILLANAQKRTRSFLTELIANLKCYELVIIEDINQFLDTPASDLQPILIIVDGQAELNMAAEITQLLKMTYPVPLFALHGPESPIDFPLFRKNGADEIVHFHFDFEFIGDLILRTAPVEFNGDIPLAALTAIDFNEISPEVSLNFDLYIHLPTNQKTILMNKKGGALNEKSLNKVKQAKQHVYFKKTETTQFIEYARACTKLRDGSATGSKTEKLIEAKNEVFAIMSEFFNTQVNNFEVGKGILNRCRKVLNEYSLLASYSPKAAAEQIFSISGQPRSFYNDAIYLANYAALFGHILGLKIEDIESLALAGLLHNIGLSYVTDYQPGMNIDSLSAASRDQYVKYPERSVNLVKTQRVPLNNEVSNIILQHRESSNGSGFPKNLTSDQLDHLTKVFHIALRVYEMTAIIDNQPRFTLKSAIGKLQSDLNEGHSEFDLVILVKALKSFKFD